MSANAPTTNVSLNMHSHDIHRTALRVTRLEVMVKVLIALQVLSILARVI